MTDVSYEPESVNVAKVCIIFLLIIIYFLYEKCNRSLKLLET